jgi:hypothetical protein
LTSITTIIFHSWVVPLHYLKQVRRDMKQQLLHVYVIYYLRWSTRYCTIYKGIERRKKDQVHFKIAPVNIFGSVRYMQICSYFMYDYFILDVYSNVKNKQEMLAIMWYYRENVYMVCIMATEMILSGMRRSISYS